MASRLVTSVTSVADLRLAESRGVRMLRNLVFDVRSGGVRRGNLDGSAHDDAIDVVNSDVTALERIFRERISPEDVLVDVGCGKGRVLSWWASRGGGNRIIGLEISDDVAGETRRRLRNYPNVVVIPGDAIANLPADGTVFFLYHPFGERTVRAFSERAKELFAGRPRASVLYYNPVHADVFRADAAWTVDDVSIGGAAYHRLCVITLA